MQTFNYSSNIFIYMIYFLDARKFNFKLSSIEKASCKNIIWVELKWKIRTYFGGNVSSLSFNWFILLALSRTTSRTGAFKYWFNNHSRVITVHELQNDFALITICCCRCHYRRFESFNSLMSFSKHLECVVTWFKYVYCIICIILVENLSIYHIY